jgi:hypothetical protein
MLLIRDYKRLGGAKARGQQEEHDRPGLVPSWT